MNIVHHHEKQTVTIPKDKYIKSVYRSCLNARLRNLAPHKIIREKAKNPTEKKGENNNAASDHYDQETDKD